MAGPSLAGLGEFGWLKKLLPRLYWPPAHYSQLCIGPGDDAGALRISPHHVLVATTDAMVEGIHFERKWFSWRDLGEKVLAVNLSDLAAMGNVKPLAALVTAAFPGDTPQNSVEHFYQGLRNCAQRWKTGFLGGDTVGSKQGWFVSVTLLGEARPTELVRRKGAKVGDLLMTTGPLGLAAAGLEALQKGKQGAASVKPLIKAFRRPRPRFTAGAILGQNQWASSLIDSSDGLAASAKLLAEASSVGMRIYVDDLPLPKALREWSAYTGRKPWSYALTGGEDYELVFTIHRKFLAKVRKALPRASVIGEVTQAREGCRAFAPGQQFRLKGYGFDHFN